MSRRRKRPQARPAGQATPPLQPAYPEFSGPGATAPPPPPPAVQPPAEPAGEALAAAPEQRRSRRRRKRGGRGRQRPPTPVQAQAPEQQPEAAPPVALEAIPEPAPAPARPPRPATQARAARGAVVLAIGLPGSGKSSWFRRRGITPLSSDLLRSLLFDNITEQRFQDLVFSTLRSLLRARLIAGMPWNYVDATNLSPKERRGWIKMAREFRYDVHAVFFDVPLEVCQERNRRRERNVPEDVMQRMAAKLRPPTFEEGFAKMTVVRVKSKEAEPAQDQDSDQPEEPGPEL